MKKQKRQAERMPRKMKKRFKKLMKFYDERRKEYEQEKLNTFIHFLILEHLKAAGIPRDEVEKIEIDDASNVYVKLKGSIRQMEITVNLEEKPDDADNI